MQIQRITRQKNTSYTTISNVIVRDNRLSLKAKGFFLTVMSLPDSWDFSVPGMATILKEGKHTIYEILKELIAFGYVERGRRYENGKIVEWTYVFNETASATLVNNVVDLLPKNLEVENLYQGNLHPEKPTQINKEGIKERTKQKKRGNTATAIDPSFVVDESETQRLSEECPTVDIRLETQNFIDHFLNKGTKGLDWTARWRMWMRNQHKWNLERKQSKPPQRDSYDICPPYEPKKEDPPFDLLAEIEEEQGKLQTIEQFEELKTWYLDRNPKAAEEIAAYERLIGQRFSQKGPAAIGGGFAGSGRTGYGKTLTPLSVSQ